MGNLNKVINMPRKALVKAVITPIEKYASIPSYARYSFDRAGFLMTLVKSTFSGHFTTPVKRSEAIIQLAEIERLCRETREALQC